MGMFHAWRSAMFHRRRPRVQVRIAQEYKGAQAVIVVDNTEMTADDIQHIIMADDGWGGPREASGSHSAAL